MSTAIQRRRGTTAQHASFAGLNGELTVDTDKEVVVVHDGATAGGYPMMRENGSNSALALGSAGTPSLKFTGDTNTGIYSPGADQVAISTGGSRRLLVSDGQIQADTLFSIAMGGAGYQTIFRNGVDESNFITHGAVGATIFRNHNGSEFMRLDSSGRLGVGTSSPGALLHLDAASESARIRFQRTSLPAFSEVGHGTAVASLNALTFTSSDSGASAPGFVWRTSTDGSTYTTRMLINSSGNVGIGTSSPSSTLDVGSGNIELGGGNNTALTWSSDVSSHYLKFTTALNGLTLNGYGGLTFETNGANERMRIDSAGRVGIGTTSPSTSWTQTNQSTATIAAGVAFFDSAGVSRGQVGLGGAATGSSAQQLYLNGSDNIALNTGGTERARIDSSGRLLVGTSSVITNSWGGTAGLLQVAQNNFLPVGLFSYTSTGGDAYCPYFELHRARGSQASPTAVINNDELGQINFYGHDGSTFIRGAAIRSYVDGTPGTNDMPGRLVFSTTADGASSPTERMRIASNGSVRINATGNLISGNERLTVDGILTVSNGGDTPFFLQRNTNDGTLISFYQDGAAEGSISVSGTTVSYNGAHLSRWSQLPAGQEREEILRGTVLSNIDEMCEWSDEENEQLNRMKVSDVEGDKNVSGVFQAWDDDDDTYINDFYCAMTGDFIIRIGAGVTVQRGDLLMSAGDGTAKPQDDDIIRSKTIAKVTSTNVSCTYDDGSYCVPCVLMAC